MHISVASVDSLIIYFSDVICEEGAKKVQSAYDVLKGYKDDFIVELIPSYTSILVRFNLLHVNYHEAKTKVENILKSAKASQKSESFRVVEIPVYYDKEVGFDLEDVADLHDLSVNEVVKIHSQKEYLVYAIGFLPGFAYMGEVDKRITAPRVANPRASIPKGSVGIADNQAAIYPQKSPGGWRILGRTPLDMFDLDFEGYSFLKVGDKVRYKPISKDEFLRQGGEI